MLIGPKPVLLGGFQIPLNQLPSTFTFRVPIGPAFSLGYLFAKYPFVEEAGQQTFNLAYKLTDERGNAYSVRPIPINQVTGPGLYSGLRATQYLGVRYPGGTWINVAISAVATAVNVNPPAWVSITLLGQAGYMNA